MRRRGAVCSALVCGVLGGTAPAQATPPSPMALTDHDRVLVIAPHPDDETLCCGGLLRQAAAHGAGTAVVWITAGDAFELDALLVERTLSPGSSTMQQLGKHRLQEGHAAADTLGIPRSAQYVLGYPDRGIEALLGSHFHRPYRSKYTASTRVRYSDAVHPGADYTGADLEHDLGQVLDTFRPTLILAPAPEDLHPDHRASGELARRLLEQRGQLGGLRYWIIHADGWPRPYGLHPDLPLDPPAQARALHWERCPLSPSERSAKLAALRQHHSQMRLMSSWMKAFVRANELFAPADALSPADSRGR